MKVSLFVSSLEGNPIVRAKPIADALVLMGHEVEVLGLLLDADRIYKPHEGSFEYISLRAGRSVFDVRRKAKRLASLATGDVAYAFKPLLTSFLPALIYSRRGCARPLLLDVEDNDVWVHAPSNARSLARILLKGWRDPNDFKYTVWLDRFVKQCTSVTISSTALQEIYGGEIILHGPAAAPAAVSIGSPEQRLLRERYGLPTGRLLLLFAGIARPHKGFDLLLEMANSELMRRHCHLVLAGDPDQPMFRAAKERYGNACSLVGAFPVGKMPELVQACDIVPVLQRNEPYAESQIPAKLLEAFAFCRPAIVTDVGDLALFVSGGSGAPRGWVLRERTAQRLEQLLRTILEGGTDELVRAGAAAQQFHNRHCSTRAIASKLGQLPPFSLSSDRS